MLRRLLDLTDSIYVSVVVAVAVSMKSPRQSPMVKPLLFSLKAPFQGKRTFHAGMLKTIQAYCVATVV